MSVTLRGVTFRYPGATDPSLESVTLQLGRRGEIAAVTGALGAGTSTLLLVAGGLAPHVTGGVLEGSVRTLGEDPTTEAGRTALAGRVGTLLPAPRTQLSGMSFTVWEEVAFGPANLGWTRERISERVDAALTLFDLMPLVDRDPQTLSGGELQLVMFAAVSAMEPSLYLLDEPAQELDSTHADRLYSELLPTLAERAGVVIATNDVDRVFHAATRMVVMDRGGVLAEGDPETVLARKDVVERGQSTTIAHIARLAGIGTPYPLTVTSAVGRVGS